MSTIRIKDPEKIVEEIKNGLGDGPLTLRIFCTKCNAQFEIGKDGAAMAILTEMPFLDYLRWVQSSPCTACNATKYTND